MNTEVTTESPTRKRLTIEVPASEVQSMFDATLAAARKDAVRPGFRKGKVPMALVRADIGEKLSAQVGETLVEHHLWQAIRDEKLEPLPKGVFLDTKEGEKDALPAVEGDAYSFAVFIDVMPEFDLPEYEGLKIARPKAELGDEDVQRELDGIRESMGHVHDVEDRASQSGDFVEVDIEGEGTDSDLKLERKAQRIHLGAEGNLPEFDKELFGLRAGAEFSFDVAYPEDFPNADFKGQAVRFSGVVNGVKERHVPELTDEMAEKVAGVATLAELRDKVREALQARKEVESTGVAKRRLLDKVLDAVSYEAPVSLVEEELRERLESIGRNMAASGVDMEKADIDWDKVIAEERVAAEKGVREQILLDRIAASEELDVTPAEIDGAIEGMAREAGTAPAEVRKELKKSGGINSLRTQLLRRKCLDWVYERADIC